MIYIRFATVVAIAWLGYYFGTPVGLDIQWPLFEALRTTSAIVFGIVAALLALVYPDAVKNALRGGAPADENDGGLGRLVTPCGHSAMLLVALVVMAPLIAWLGTFNPNDVTGNAATIRKGTFSVFCVLSYWQIRILLMVLIPFDDLYTKVTVGIRRVRLRRDMHSNGRS
ncbi:hypothetical protein [Massilia scottii]|uniref:hypothetical protein n=1 Tax=Massilia scottii TaxID=3057166 RepID=UPI0027967E1D|nr:hypothetical protein [Massilia sp. CCM 9029]MDQ1830182.1 hypothetical protein [Massilia sp. CCM 9029]